MEWKYLILMLIAMIFMHIWDDFGRQGILAQLKQRSWWKENAPAFLYRHDYIAALIIHSIDCAIFIMIPVAAPAFILNNQYLLWMLIPMLIINTTLHAIIDNLKCNKHRIKLWEDQLMHLFQIFMTWIVAIIFL